MEFNILLTQVIFHLANSTRFKDNYKKYSDSSAVPKYATFVI